METFNGCFTNLTRDDDDGNKKSREAIKALLNTPKGLIIGFRSHRAMKNEVLPQQITLGNPAVKLQQRRLRLGFAMKNLHNFLA
ncbi:hypothetical protein ACTXT7_000527 [Hymenolepis weldensis]